MRKKKDDRVAFRVTQQERAQLKEAAEEYHLSESAYVRIIALQQKKMIVPAEIRELLQDLKREDIAVGRNINQAVRNCNGKGFVTESDYGKLLQELVKLNGYYCAVCRKLDEVLEKDGNHKTASSERKPGT